MPSDRISYQHSGFFSPLIIDYLNRDPKVRSLYHRFPSIDNFEAQIEQKKTAYPIENRRVLKRVLEQQYAGVEMSDQTRANIAALGEETAFTIVTGHQLNLFTGPLYFIYKIVNAISLSTQLSERYPQYSFVPVYWMATEDHDFEEISSFELFGQKLRWERNSGGPVGRLSTDGLDAVFEQLEEILPPSDTANELKTLFKAAYLEHSRLSDATRFLANALFSEYGLVIIDADHRELKQLFTSHLWTDLEQKTAFEKISETALQMSGYHVQVNPREVNVFYMENGLRERIIAEKNGFSVNNTQLRFSTEEMRKQLNETPEKFSPNVILRPLYQEVILPNLCYIGGAGEIAYWLELKSFFDASEIAFPMLLVRNAVVYATQKQMKKARELGLSWADLFLKPADLKRDYTTRISDIPLSLSDAKWALAREFEKIDALALRTDASFTGAVEAAKVRIEKQLNTLEKRLLKAQQRKFSDTLNRVSDLQNDIFPNGGLQERRWNFAQIYVSLGRAMIEELLASFDPIGQEFTLLTYEAAPH